MDATLKPAGVVVPIATPFTDDRALDEAALDKILDHLLAGGVDGIYALGTTGEVHSQSLAMRRRVIERIVRHVDRKAAVYGGVSHNCMAESLHAAEEYFELGVDAVFAHLPFYYKLDDAQILDYFTELVEQLPGPFILYNMPITIYMSIPLPVVEILSRHPRVIGIKDSEKDLQRLQLLADTYRQRDDFSVLFGLGELSREYLQPRPDGLVLGVSNLVPRLSKSLMQALQNNDWQNVDDCLQRINAARNAYNIGASLADDITATKAAMNTLHLCGPTMLPPLRTCSADQQRQIAERLHATKIFDEAARS